MDIPEKNPFEEKSNQVSQENNNLLEDASFTNTEPDSKFQNEQYDFNGQPTTSEKYPRKNIIFIVIIILSLLGFVALGMFGMNIYKKNAKRVNVLSILPKDPNMVLTITIDPNSDQFKMLESNLQKFPGYKTLINSFSDAKEEKSASDLIQEKIKEFNLDLEKDLLPALDSKAYIVINDLSPLNNQIRNGNFSGLTSATPEISGLETKDKNNPKLRIDFITAIKINDISRAKNALSKMKKNNDYKFTEKKYRGYKYYEINLKSDKNTDTNHEKIFGAIVGKNWLVASKEEELKNSFDKADKIGLFIGSSNKNKIESLENNTDFKKISENLNSDASKESLASFYLKLNFNIFFREGCDKDKNQNCFDTPEYIKNPEDFIMGIDLRSNNDGIAIASISNQNNLSGTPNHSFTEGFSKRLPQQIDGRWTDILLEYADPKGLYYNLKKNNLTEKGLEEHKKIMSSINQMTGIDFESDIIDQINGNSGIVVFTKENMEPEGALIMPIKDSQKMYATIEKFTETIKDSLIQFDPMNSASMGSTKTQTIQQKKYLDESMKKIASIKSAKISMTETSGGRIYSFKIANDPLLSMISFDFSLENNELIFSSHYAVVESLLKTAKSSASDALAQNSLYSRFQKYTPDQGYAQSFIVSQAIVNIVSYFTQDITNKLSGSMERGAVQTNHDNTGIKMQEKDDSLYAFSAILRTIKFIGATQSSEGNFSKSYAFFDIKELPVEEKERAEKAIAKENNRDNSF